MKKKNAQKVKHVATRKSIRKVVKRKSNRKSLTPLLIFSLLLISTICIFIQKPTIQFQHRAPQLPKQLSMRIPTPTLAKAHAPLPLIKKAQAETNEKSDYCISVPVLFYHHVEPLGDAQESGHAQFTVDSQIFDMQMSYLKEQGYMAVPVDTIVDGIVNKRNLPQKTIAITFDDGYADMYTYAYPVLKKYGFVGNFAIPTGLLDAPGYMNWSQITEIARDPLMNIYNHTSSHADLVHNPLQTESEITTAQNDIQNRLGLRSNIFFYPYGSFNQTIIASLRSKGYIAAFSTLPGTLQCESSLMYLSRSRIGNAPLSFYGL